jgi:hypothetical protein
LYFATIVLYGCGALSMRLLQVCGEGEEAEPDQERRKCIVDDVAIT